MTATEPRETFSDQFALGPKNRHAYTPLVEPKHPHSVQLVQFWQEGEKAGGLVVGRDIPSRPIAAILRNLMICEPIADFSDFRIRHAGIAYITHYGHDVTGKLMSDVFDYEVVQLPVWGPDKKSRWMLCGMFRFE